MIRHNFSNNEIAHHAKELVLFTPTYKNFEQILSNHNQLTKNKIQIYKI